ncbi:hypothetical protein FRC12_014389 [Ceratobasidium sp. 428]|nr:hypothetical protein FRC12_014389 [Ceratobasidium sp. 428]
MSDAFRDVPEFFEVELGECISARTETLASFRELGPPDLCHVVKTAGRAGQKDIGSYHYISGVDASSSASLAAYLNSLTYALESESGWFAKGTSWKLRVGSYWYAVITPFLASMFASTSKSQEESRPTPSTSVETDTKPPLPCGKKPIYQHSYALFTTRTIPTID